MCMNVLVYFHSTMTNTVTNTVSVVSGTLQRKGSSFWFSYRLHPIIAGKSQRQELERRGPVSSTVESRQQRPIDTCCSSSNSLFHPTQSSAQDMVLPSFSVGFPMPMNSIKFFTGQRNLHNPDMSFPGHSSRYQVDN